MDGSEEAGAGRRATPREAGGGGEASVSGTGGRKREHLLLALSGDVASTRSTGLEAVRLRARALPERDLAGVDLSLTLWDRQLSAPLLVSCMTGGVAEAGPVNRALAVAAQRHGIALGLGSGRALLEDPSAAATFQVRDLAPDVPILANIGAVQLRAYDPAACLRLVELCEADALVVHLNAVQEAVQPGGEPAFGGVLARIRALCAALPVPVVAKEVGFGMAPEDVVALAEAGVAAVDVAGAGGTNWARLEGLRQERAGEVAAAFADWGWSTTASVLAARAALDEHGPQPGVRALLIGSGGVGDGVDACKLLCLGADLVGLGRGLLAAAAEGPDAAAGRVGVIVEQLRIAAWAVGAGVVGDLDVSRLQ